MRARRLVAAAAAILLIATACGDDDSSTTEGGATTTEGATTTAPAADDAGATTTEGATTTAAPADPMADLIAAAQAEGSISVRSVFPESVEAELFKEFEEKYGITVDYSRKGGSPPTLQSWLTEVEAGQNLVDVMQIGRAIAEGAPLDLLADYETVNDANLLDIYTVDDPKFHTIVSSAYPLVYNTDLVDPSELPTSYEGLTDPRWTGKLAFGTPENSFAAAAFIYAAEQAFGQEWVEAFANQDLLETEREVEAADFVARGEREVAVISQTAPAAQLEAGAPLGFHWPEGVLNSTYVAVIPTDAPHPNAARLFVNFLLSVEHQQRAADQLRINPVVQDVTPPEGFPDLTPLNPTDIPIQTLMETRDRIVDLWRSLAG